MCPRAEKRNSPANRHRPTKRIRLAVMLIDSAYRGGTGFAPLGWHPNWHKTLDESNARADKRASRHRHGTSQLRASFGGTRPNEPLANEATKAVGFERNGVLQIRQAVREAHMPWIRPDGDEHRVPLPSQRFQNSPFASVEIGQVARTLQIEKATIQPQNQHGADEKIFGALRDK